MSKIYLECQYIGYYNTWLSSHSPDIFFLHCFGFFCLFLLPNRSFIYIDTSRYFVSAYFFEYLDGEEAKYYVESIAKTFKNFTKIKFLV